MAAMTNFLISHRRRNRNSEVAVDSVGLVVGPAKIRIVYVGVDLVFAPVFIQIAADSVSSRRRMCHLGNMAAATGGNNIIVDNCVLPF